MAARAAIPFSLLLRCQQANRARFFAHGCDESRQTPIRIKRSAIFRLRPGGLAAPEERWCRFVSNGFITDPWLSVIRRQSLDGSRRRRSALLHSGDGEPAFHSDQMVVAPVPKSGLAGCRRYSCETARHIKGLVLLQNVVARPGQFVRQCLDRDCVVRLCFLPFVKSFGFSAVAQGEVGSFDKSPGQVFVAVLGVSFAFLLAVAGATAVNAACIATIGDRPRLFPVLPGSLDFPWIDDGHTGRIIGGSVT